MQRHNKGEILYTKTTLSFELNNYFAFNDKYKNTEFVRPLVWNKFRTGTLQNAQKKNN